MNINKEILKTIKYFSFFAYNPTLKEIHIFLSVKIGKKELKAELNHMKYTPTQYDVRKKISKRKLNSWKFKLYIKLLSFFPQIKLVGLSGSIAMMNSNLDDDIDLFIITSKNRLFTARFLATTFAFIIGLKRRIGLDKAPDKICLNLFFDESNLTVPNGKKTEFVGHEILQMKPLVNKDGIYEQFLQANKWVFRLFPNAFPPVIPSDPAKRGESRDLFKKISHFVRNDTVSNYLEKLLKNLQLSLIRRHQTTEIITDSQLWFHPVDFGKKVLRHSREGGNPD